MLAHRGDKLPANKSGWSCQLSTADAPVQQRCLVPNISFPFADTLKVILGLLALFLVAWIGLRTSLRGKNAEQIFGPVSGWISKHAHRFDSRKEVLVWVSVLVLLWVGVNVLRLVVTGKVESLPPSAFEPLFTTAVILAPPSEEIFFRWLVLGLFVRHRAATPIALTFASAMWVAFHYVQPTMTHSVWNIGTDVVFAAILMKVCLGNRWYLTWPIHAIYNLIVVLVALAVWVLQHTT